MRYLVRKVNSVNYQILQKCLFSASAKEEITHEIPKHLLKLEDEEDPSFFQVGILNFTIYFLLLSIFVFLMLSDPIASHSPAFSYSQLIQFLSQCVSTKFI